MVEDIGRTTSHSETDEDPTVASYITQDVFKKKNLTRATSEAKEVLKEMSTNGPARRSRNVFDALCDAEILRRLKASDLSHHNSFNCTALLMTLIHDREG